MTVSHGEIFMFEQSVQLLLAIIESSEVASILLPPLINMGLPNLLIKLLDFEMNILMNDRVSERYVLFGFESMPHSFFSIA